MALLKVSNLRKNVSMSFSLYIDNIELNSSEILCLVGKNGAGKSTLLRILSGLSSYNSGDIFIEDRPIKSIKDLSSYIGYVQQTKGLPDELTINEYLHHQSLIRNCDTYSIKELIHLADLDKFLNLKIMNLSQGTKRKLHILSAVLQKPKILILDEPTVGIDASVSMEIMDYIINLRNIGISTILTTHHFDEIEKLNSKIITIENGRISHLLTSEYISNFSRKDNALIISLKESSRNKELINFLNDNNFDFILKAQLINDKVVLTLDKNCVNKFELISKVIESNHFQLDSISIYKLSFKDTLIQILNEDLYNNI